jgi:2-oxoglutarate ferredoxin oxidoreductase subunit delta
LETPTKTLTTSTVTGTKIIILEEYCKGCNICVEVCPKDTLAMVPVGTRWQGSVVKTVDVDTCISCMLCDLQCPDFAISVIKGDKKKKKKATA